MREQAEREEGGFVIVVLLTLLIPMLLVVGAFSITMTSRTKELNVEMDQERALMAAEAGVDDALFKASTTGLVDGMTFQRTLANGLSFESVVTHLYVDNIDNDGDGLKDALDKDEDVFQVVVTGTSRTTERRIAAYLGRVVSLVDTKSAMALQNPSVTLDLHGTSIVSGQDVDMNNVPTGVVEPGMSIEAPGTVADLDAELTGAERDQVRGAGYMAGTPSLALASTAVDLTTLVPQLQNAANIVLTSNHYSAFDFGNGQAGVANITYREGDVKFAGNTQGAGILVVTGDLELKGTFRFDGVIIVLGRINNSGGTADVFGSIIQGPTGGSILMKGTMVVQYSKDAVNLANNLGIPRYAAFNGWQELSR